MAGFASGSESKNSYLVHCLISVCGTLLDQHSQVGIFYTIKNLDEALAFLNDEYLGGHLIEISKALMQLDSDNPTEIFGNPDDMKLRSCMTLFAAISDDNSIFHKVINKYFDGKPDKKTRGILQLE